MPNIRISETLARWIMTTTRHLISHMYAQEYDPATGEFNPGTDYNSIFRRLPQEDPELRYWINSVIQFCKTMAGIMNHEITLLEQVELLPFIGDDKENEI